MSKKERKNTDRERRVSLYRKGTHDNATVAFIFNGQLNLFLVRKTNGENNWSQLVVTLELSVCEMATSSAQGHNLLCPYLEASSFTLGRLTSK